MLFFTLSLIGLVGLSLLTFAIPAPARYRARGRYGRPPADWPDVPVEALGLFRRDGLINQHCVRPPSPMRVASFGAAQDVLLERVTPTASDPPRIVLRLCCDDPEWTEVELNGECVALVPTQALVGHRG